MPVVDGNRKKSNNNNTNNNIESNITSKYSLHKVENLHFITEKCEKAHGHQPLSSERMQAMFSINDSMR